MTNQKAPSQSDKQNQQKPKTTQTEGLPEGLSGIMEGLGKFPGDLRTQASLLKDTRFSTTARQEMAENVGKTAGNQYLQRALLEGAEPGLVQREEGVLSAIGEWFQGLFSSDPEDVVRNLDTGLSRAHTVTEAAARTTTDPRMRTRIQGLSRRLGGLQRATGGLVQVLDTAEKIGQVEDLVTALNDIPDDIASDPAAAADAFGRLFAAAGELGGSLPPGPWTPYFTFLGGMENFFTNMLTALDPGRRWAREFEEMERESH